MGDFDEGELWHDDKERSREELFEARQSVGNFERWQKVHQIMGTIREIWWLILLWRGYGR